MRNKACRMMDLETGVGRGALAVGSWQGTGSGDQEMGGQWLMRNEACRMMNLETEVGKVAGEKAREGSHGVTESAEDELRVAGGKQGTEMEDGDQDVTESGSIPWVTAAIGPRQSPPPPWRRR